VNGWRRRITVNAVWPQEALLSHWRSDALLLSQTCGFPLVTQLPDVQTVGCFHYSAPGCDGFHYRSLLVTRGKHPANAGGFPWPRGGLQ
jgi:hypothetical protein